jgi:hypothetical protein
MMWKLRTDRELLSRMLRPSIAASSMDTAPVLAAKAGIQGYSMGYEIAAW